MPPLAAYAALAATDAVLAATGRDRLHRLTKPLLMPLLMAGRDRPTRIALALGGAGDVALLGRSDAAFTAGLSSFLAGHAAWTSALRRARTAAGCRGVLRERPALAVPYLAAFGALNAYLWTRTGKDRPAVLAYSTALLATALAALDSGSRRAAAGGVLFLVSDSLLALERYGDVRLPGHEGVVMATYAGAQALLAEGVTRRAHPGEGVTRWDHPAR